MKNLMKKIVLAAGLLSMVSCNAKIGNTVRNNMLGPKGVTGSCTRSDVTYGDQPSYKCYGDGLSVYGRCTRHGAVFAKFGAKGSPSDIYSIIKKDKNRGDSRKNVWNLGVITGSSECPKCSNQITADKMYFSGCSYQFAGVRSGSSYNAQIKMIVNKSVSKSKVDIHNVSLYTKGYMAVQYR